MKTKSITVDISETLHDRLYRVASEFRGRHERDKRRKEPYAAFINDAVENALTEYLDKYSNNS